MKRLALLPLIALAVAACHDTTTAPTSGPASLTVNAANAPNGAHFAQGFAQPVCTTSDDVVSCTATQINGVGNINANLNLSVTWEAVCNCTNHGGKLVPVKSQLTDASSVSLGLASKNGNMAVPAITSGDPPADQEFLDQAVCPNGNWTKSLAAGDPVVTGFTYTLTFAGFGGAYITLP